MPFPHSTSSRQQAGSRKKAMAAAETQRRTRAATAAKRAARERTVSGSRRQPSVAAATAARHDYDADDADSEEEETKGSSADEKRAEHAAAASRAQEQDAQRRVLSGAFLAQAGKNASELARRLKQAWTLLQQLPNQHQEDADVPLDGLRLVCAELLHERVLAADEKIVRSLAACCFAELLRVHAPESPFHSNEELYDAFQLILEQIRCLAADTNSDPGAAGTACDAHCFHVLESLASAKSCVLLVGVDFCVEEGEETLLVQLFKTLFETIRREHSAKIEALMVAIMSGCIEEVDMIEQPLLDAMLTPLVQASVADARDDRNETGVRGPYHLAQELIRRTSDHLQSQLSHFFNSILVDAPTALTAHKSSALKEHVYALIYEVHKTSPSLLLYVLPNVCLQLQVDEVATRSEAVALMGRLFASSHADYGHQYMKNFRDFLGRFRDVSKEIRLQMIQVCAIVWQRKAELGGMIEKEFVLRLSDPDWEVRRLVVNEVCDLAANSLELVSEECLRQVGERMKDKKVVLRKETMTGLSQVYAAHISARWSRSSDGDEEGSLSVHHVPTAHAKKLGWVPDFVLKCFAYPQQELRLRVVQLLDDILLPKASPDAVRAKGLLYIFHSVDQTSKEALRRIFSERAKCVQVCREFVAAKKRHRLLWKSRAEVTSSDLSDATGKLYSELSPLFPEVANLRKLLEQLSAWKDQSVFKHMEHLCDYSKSLVDIRSARDQLVKCVGSKSPLGEFMKTLCRKLNLLTLSRSSISTYMDFFVQNDVWQAKENRDIADLMVMVSKIMPAIFAPFIKNEFEAILLVDDDANTEKDGDDGDGDEDDESESKRDQRVIEGMLGVLANYSEHWKTLMDRGDAVDSEVSADDSAPSKLLLKQLEKYCWNPSIGDDSTRSSAALSAAEVHVAKLAALSIANFCSMSKDTSLLIQKLCAKKRLSSPSSPGAAATLQSLLVFTKRCGRDMATNASLVTSLWSTLREQFLLNDSDHADAQSKNRKRALTQAKLVDIRCLAIRVMVNVVLHCRLEYELSEFKERSQQVMELLFDLLRSDGRKWTSNAGFAVKYRTVASSSLLKLMRNASVERLVTVSEWHVLGFVMQDSSEDVRSTFLQKLTSHLMKHAAPHPHKYLSYLVLAASESNSALKKKARNLLGVAVQRMRRMFEASLARGRSGGSSAEASALMVPEYALPYVLHLLAHHPDFPKEAAQRSVSLHASLFHNPVWSSQLVHLSFFLDGLVPSNASAEADNIAFLLQMLAKLSECDDVTDPSSTNIYPLVDSAALLVKKKIKNQSSLRPFPGKIYLPKQLFAAGRGKGPTLSAAAPGTDARFGAVARDVNDSARPRGPRIMVSVLDVLLDCKECETLCVRLSNSQSCLLLCADVAISDQRLRHSRPLHAAEDAAGVCEEAEIIRRNPRFEPKGCQEERRVISDPR